MALSPLVIAIPIVLMAAMGGGKKRRGRIPAAPEPLPGEGDDSLFGPEGRPVSNRMILTPDCADLSVRVRKWDYDIRITNYYWYLRDQGVDDPVVLAAEILKMDSPHCQWPAPPDAPQWSRVIWEGTYAAVKNYYDLEQSGELWEYAEDPFAPESYTGVKPLVPW